MTGEQRTALFDLLTKHDPATFMVSPFLAGKDDLIVVFAGDDGESVPPILIAADGTVRDRSPGEETT